MPIKKGRYPARISYPINRTARDMTLYMLDEGLFMNANNTLSAALRTGVEKMMRRKKAP